MIRVPPPQGTTIEVGEDGFAWQYGKLRVIASWGGGWDHVSVSLADRIPTWTEMSWVARIFFPNETCCQLHLPLEEHINCHPPLSPPVASTRLRDPTPSLMDGGAIERATHGAHDMKTEQDRAEAQALIRSLDGMGDTMLSRDVEKIADALAKAREEGAQAAYDHVARARHLPGDPLCTIQIDGGVVNGLRVVEMRTAAPTGHILDDQGVVRKMLGSLPLTADGCVVGHGADLFYPFDTTSVDRVRYKSYVNGMGSIESAMPPQSMYSTREAAEAAVAAKGADHAK